ncbi:FecR domain-containing protein [uncultured Alistipes sp.]|uniref:FecR family protein n=1 Tax=uncultured Alistipes sp. TaxID=538949 RepID=UPI0025FF1FC9|nr:FecR domain-containing protein [uncultured Alistipes sp.]
MDKEEKDMERTDVDKLLSRIVYKAPANSRMEEIGGILARRRAAIRRKETFRHRLMQWSIAAGIVVMSVLGCLVHFSRVDIDSGEREVACVLPDGSEVTVMPNSGLSYNRFTWTLRRRVLLNGEALFSVTHGRRFGVTTPAGRVAVLGTRFRVIQRGEDMLVECYEGAVRVEVAAAKLVVRPGQRVRSDAGGVTLSDIEKPLPPVVSFEAVPLKEVIRSIETIFGVSVSGGEKYGELVFTGYIMTADMDETLEAVFRSCGIPYEVSAGEILLK